ncbi:MAG: aldo/keto reductase [Oscillospiraceae bacterium]|nr:aldo/keto reductase [Oscillospiraceae bacterium]
MQYRKDRYGNPLSVLGYGCMRFTQSVGGIDLKKAEKEILAAIQAGVNYFDTAYIYPGSEAALGEILERNGLRDKVRIATKLPHYLAKDLKSLDKFFAEELRRLRTDHVDYYLMHMLTDVKTWERLNSIGAEDWLREKKESGAIGQVGFSYHGNSDMFISLLNAYDWDFCQIQYNYLDEHSQAGVTGLKAAAEKGIPVIIMEPLRGGKLANKLPKEAEELFRKYPTQHSPAEWAFRWLWDQPEVTCVLSGMNSLEMVAENCAAADEATAGTFTKEDRELIALVVKAINSRMKVGCTGCRYCMPCPKNVDIPGIFAAYNRRASEGWISAMQGYFMCTALRKDATGASNCVGCGKCEQHCPQGIQIRKELQACKKTFEGPIYKVGRKLITTFTKY